MHYTLPAAVMSVSIEQGLFGSSYLLYRDHTIRDLHFDLGYRWQVYHSAPCLMLTTLTVP